MEKRTKITEKEAYAFMDGAMFACMYLGEITDAEEAIKAAQKLFLKWCDIEGITEVEEEED